MSNVSYERCNGVVVYSEYSVCPLKVNTLSRDLNVCYYETRELLSDSTICDNNKIIIIITGNEVPVGTKK